MALSARRREEAVVDQPAPGRRAAAVAARVAYGAAFVVALPVGLVAWARATAPWVSLPAPHAPWAGRLAAALGVALVAWGMAALWRRGGGLPMNAFPPRRFVRAGPYRVLAHPIYVGAVLAWAGGAVAAGSASALWLVTPALALGCAALVLGYERDDLAARHGAEARAGLPLADDAPRRPAGAERLGTAVRALAPWGIAAVGLGAIHGEAMLGRELTPAPALAATGVLAVAAGPLAARTARELRRLERAAACAAAGGLLAGLAWPGGAPSQAVAAAALGAAVLAGRWPRLRLAFAAWAAAVAVAAGAAGSAVNAAAGVALGLGALRADALWEVLRRAAEGVANSWREWRLGPVRVINHGLWAGLATAAGISIVVGLVGSAFAAPALLVWAGALVGAALWAQVLEGASGLSRPFGFYGGLLGGALAIPVAGALWGDPWRLAAAYAVAIPAVQALGRLRCLVQGCCHGRPAPGWLGIRYGHPRSRVVRAQLGGVPLHPTPLYSVLWCGAWLALLARLWSLGVPLPAVVGASLLLSGVGRFVEEAYRGEPQTPVVLGLRCYQWLAAACAVAGAALTCVPGAPSGWPAAAASAPWHALLAGVVSAAALGVDAPEGRRRFSRLA